MYGVLDTPLHRSLQTFPFPASVVVKEGSDSLGVVEHTLILSHRLFRLCTEVGRDRGA